MSGNDNRLTNLEMELVSIQIRSHVHTPPMLLPDNLLLHLLRDLDTFIQVTRHVSFKISVHHIVELSLARNVVVRGITV